MSGALAWAVADPSNGGHSGFAQGHHRHRRSRRPSATCTGGGWRSGCPRISLGASWRQAAAYLTTFECDLEVLRGSRCRFAKSEAIGGGGRGELDGATSLPPPRSAEHRAMLGRSVGPLGGAKTTADLTRGVCQAASASTSRPAPTSGRPRRQALELTAAAAACGTPPSASRRPSLRLRCEAEHALADAWRGTRRGAAPRVRTHGAPPGAVRAYRPTYLPSVPCRRLTPDLPTYPLCLVVTWTYLL